MEIYSPKKFQSISFRENTLDPNGKKKNEPSPQGKEQRTVKNKKSKEMVQEGESEGIAERMRRVFFERLKAFFEYEEVS